MTRKFRVHIKCDTDEEIKEQLRTATEILVKMREAQIKFKAEFGYVNKSKMHEAEADADAWIETHKIYYNVEPAN